MKIANEKNQQKSKKSKNIGKENRFKSAKVKSAGTKNIRSEMNKPKLAKDSSKINKNVKPVLNYVTKSVQNTDTGRNVPTTGGRNTNTEFSLPPDSALVGYINSFTPSPTSDTTATEYLPIIYKEIVAIKHQLGIFGQAQAQGFEKLENMERVIHEEIKTINPQVNVLTPEDIKEIDAELPKKLVDLVLDFEVKLDSDPVYKNKMTLRMKKLGGKKPNLMVRTIMKKLIIDPVLDRFTWRGTPDKKIFQNMININDVVYNATSGVFQKYTLHRYQKYMVEFLKHSSSRQREPVKYRKKRGAAESATENGEGSDKEEYRFENYDELDCENDENEEDEDDEGNEEDEEEDEEEEEEDED